MKAGEPTLEDLQKGAQDAQAETGEQMDHMIAENLPERIKEFTEKVEKELVDLEKDVEELCAEEEKARAEGKEPAADVEEEEST